MTKFESAKYFIITGLLFLFQLVFAQEVYPEMSSVTPKSEAQPCLSPDGEWVLYSSGDGFAKNLYVINLANNERKQLTHNDMEDSHARWSPDGKLIVFQREDTLGNRDLWLIDSEGSNERNITNSENFREQHPRFSNDNKLVIFDSNRDEPNPDAELQNYEIYSLDLESQKVNRLTNWARWDMYPSFSPDRKQIAFRRALAVPDSDSQNFEIFVKNLETGEEVIVSNDEAFDSNPHWSPAGDWIVFASNRSGSYNLYIVQPDGSQLRMITQAEGRSIGFSIPSFSFDGNKIVANRYIKGVADMVVLDMSSILD